MRPTRVRMVAQPASVPAARRFVGHALTTWGRTDLIDDVGLSVTELATNVALHSTSSYFDLELRPSRGAVRVSVSDGGAAGGRSIAAQLDHPDPVSAPEADPDLASESMTGRGLLIVSALASSWGVEELPDGTRVWADFTASQDTPQAQPPELAGLPAEGAPAGRSSLRTVELRDCPPELFLAHEENLADVARELALLATSHADERAAEAAGTMTEVAQSLAPSWGPAHQVAAQAVQEGRARVDLVLTPPPEQDLDGILAGTAALQRAVALAEELAGQDLLMTPPASSQLQQWRAWLTTEVTEQASTGRPPRPFPGAPG